MNGLLNVSIYLSNDEARVLFCRNVLVVVCHAVVVGAGNAVECTWR